MSLDTITYTGTLTVTHCGVCGTYFAIPQDLYDECQRDHSSNFWCPLGHRLHFTGPTPEQKLQAKLDATADQLHAAQVEAESRRAQIMRDRFRYSRGVCPCCNRSFPALARHMSTQHPDYDAHELRAVKGYRCSCGRSFETPRGLAIHQGHARSDEWTDPNRGMWGRHLTVAAKS